MEMRRLVRKAARALGYDIARQQAWTRAAALLTGISADDQAIVRRIAPYTMTSIERQITLIHAVRQLVRSGTPGCFIECGVWRGGSTMAAALALAQEGDTDRDLYLFDTFEGMTAPTDVDKLANGTLARTHLQRQEKGAGTWAYAGIEEVRANMMSTNYPWNRVHFVQGPVEQTIPAHAPPAPIALLRLDTDWYESTKHEMVHLFPLLCKGGILIVDDYGHWQGARKAIDEYLVEQARREVLHRIDYTGRLLIKE
jgi:O-methyltransferase